jgi:hypothetical protein
MALTEQQRQGLITWLQANAYKATTVRNREVGTKDVDGKPVYEDYIENVDEFDADGNFVRTVEQTRTRRAVTLVPYTELDFEEVVLRVKAKARKQGFTFTAQEVYDFLSPYIDNILTWAGAESIGTSDRKPSEVDAEDPDA